MTNATLGRRRCRSLCAGLLLLVAAGIVAPPTVVAGDKGDPPPDVPADAPPTAPSADVFFGVDGQPVTNATINGIQLANGNRIFLGTFNAPDGTWSITYNLIADLISNPQTSLAGTVKVTNNSALTRSFVSGFSVPVCPRIENGSQLGGAVTVTLTASGPGTLTCIPGQPIVQTVVDGVVVQSVFFCPFNLSTTGSGTASSNTVYGLPGLTVVGPESIVMIGERQQYSLTAWDSATVQVSLQFKDSDGSATPACPEDLNGDGVIDGQDLLVIFTNWGQSSWCAAQLAGDINGDGAVNAADMVEVLEGWGECEIGK
jgi:hypothetical protein